MMTLRAWCQTCFSDSKLWLLREFCKWFCSIKLLSLIQSCLPELDVFSGVVWPSQHNTSIKNHSYSSNHLFKYHSTTVNSKSGCWNLLLKYEEPSWQITQQHLVAFSKTVKVRHPLAFQMCIIFYTVLFPLPTNTWSSINLKRYVKPFGCYCMIIILLYLSISCLPKESLADGM